MLNFFYDKTSLLDLVTQTENMSKVLKLLLSKNGAKNHIFLAGKVIFFCQDVPKPLWSGRTSGEYVTKEVDKVKSAMKGERLMFSPSDSS